ncbi:hypothetical protein GCM10010435_67430 [Winogradskya consettensis]|uniref:Uncharacterized protein n=1 Tax=Winogradskya consettensis TaxID=113560 RepID=A0A919SJD2_9ACTN|nr:hypothetical protein Aco04nite_37340 [Actinoplanes consettensis]
MHDGFRGRGCRVGEIEKVTGDVGQLGGTVTAQRPFYQIVGRHELTVVYPPGAGQRSFAGCGTPVMASRNR